jgi:hypothetical protein
MPLIEYQRYPNVNGIWACEPPPELRIRQAADGTTTRERTMLGVKHYPKDYVTACRKRVDAQLAAYRKLAAAAAKGKAGTALEAFAPGYFNSMVIVLEGCFTHRLRGV